MGAALGGPLPAGHYGGAVKWKLIAAVGALAGGALWMARRKRQQGLDAELWAEATDPVARFGG